ncbi:MAG: carbohydrate ABC transporter permease [Chloroflexota bacterium]|nr:MAG: carbohydrate ABC transporter permease [Chloroflexota bacterium]
MTRAAQRQLGHTALHLALLGGLAAVLMPMAFALSTSLKPYGDLFVYPPVWVPIPPKWDNCVEALTFVPFHLYFFNTSLITGLDITGKLLSCSLVAFAFARLRWWGRDTLFIVMVATLMLPPQVTLIPQFVIWKELGWIDTFVPLILPNFFGGPFMTFLLRQFFMSIPRELDDAARIDGCSSFGIFWRIILPLSRPALMAVTVFVFNTTWNEFLAPLIYLHSKTNFTIALGLRAFQSEHGPEWHLVMAAALVVMLPILVVFFFGQRYFIQGIVFTGVKG